MNSGDQHRPRGGAQVIDDRAWILEMLGAIVVIEIPIDRLEGKLKMSQDDTLQDRVGTVQGLLSEPGDGAHCVADWVQRAMGN